MSVLGITGEDVAQSSRNYWLLREELNRKIAAPQHFPICTPSRSSMPDPETERLLREAEADARRFAHDRPLIRKPL